MLSRCTFANRSLARRSFTKPGRAVSFRSSRVSRLVNPTANVVVGELKEKGALFAGNDWSERSTQGQFDMCAGRAPTVAKPRPTFDDPNEVKAKVSVTLNGHCRRVLDIGALEIGQ